MKFLSDEFLSKYNDAPEHMTEIGEFVYYRTYSRWLSNLGRRETWKETCARAVEYNISLEYRHFSNKGIEKAESLNDLKKEAELLFDNMFNLKQFLSGRTLWIGGTEAGAKYPMSNFNCAFVDVKSWKDLGDLFYLLLIGTGVGFKCTKQNASKLHKLFLPENIIHKDYKFIGENGVEGSTEQSENFATIIVGDSKEGWVQSFNSFINILIEGKVKTLNIIYDNIRPKGERLLTFGGTASGHEPLMQMFKGIESMLRGELDTTTIKPIDGQVRPVHVLDIGNLIGNNVVCGGVRRTAEIFLCDSDDWESIFAKFGINGIWGDEGLSLLKKIKDKMNTIRGVDHKVVDALLVDPMCKTHLHHRRMSNNSIAFNDKPSENVMELLCLIMKLEGEPGFINLAAAEKRRPNVKGLNPCAEILLDSYGVCNLTTINLSADWENLEELKLAQSLSARAGLRMTLAQLELPHWDKIQQRDRLLGCSITGVQDAGYNWHELQDILLMLRNTANDTASDYATFLGVNRPLLVTTVKPEGTLSIVAGGVSSGIHFSHSEYFIRRIRINSHDPLARMALDLGWRVHPEVGQEMESATTLVIDFPVNSPAQRHKKNVDAKEQLYIYKMFQEKYTDHNTSNTIHVKPSEWVDLPNQLLNMWNDYIGISFLADDGGTYPLAPYEECSKEEYELLKSSMKKFDAKLLQKYDKGIIDVGNESCEGGACPIR
jgi:ribonucleoside-diphosphate reductase alpha chain/ribonucleoside-triphosphate reductase